MSKSLHWCLSIEQIWPIEALFFGAEKSRIFFYGPKLFLHRRQFSDLF
ncbi:hypothetical protein [Vibrio vulnificus YJ016]|uniref:Uncharacterized protein n=1 Tax=Vibrio vulnificus (strain YJ016) TaxID=196600 RepID=Q7MFM7_VIBVY|nr:hypothetical protein [Vibrio vulnificus YJ016]